MIELYFLVRSDSRNRSLFVRGKLSFYLCVPVMLLYVMAYTSFGSPDEDVYLESDRINTWTSINEQLRESTLLPPSLCVFPHAKPADSVDAITAAIQSDVNHYIHAYQDQTPFWGMYFRTIARQDTDFDETSIDYRLEWNLFKNGRYEMQRNFDKKRSQNELQTLQLLNDVMQHRLNQKLDEIELLKRSVQFEQASDLDRLLSSILHRRQAQLENGYITRDDFDHIQLKHQQAAMKKKLYEAGNTAFLSPSVRDLLNCGEFIELKNVEEIKELAIQKAYSVKIQENLANRSEFSRSWSDDVIFNIYIEQRDHADLDAENNLGFEVKLPLHLYSKRNSLIETERKLYEKQVVVLKKRIAANVGKLNDFFSFNQYRIRVMLLELEKITRKESYELERAKRALEDLDYTPERSLDALAVEKNDVCYEIVMTRLKLYEIMAKLMALTHSEDPQVLIAETHSNCWNQ